MKLQCDNVTYLIKHICCHLASIMSDSFRSSLMARSAFTRLIVVAVVLAGLWAAIAWAVALP